MNWGPLIIGDEVTGGRVCKSGYPLSGYPDLSVNFMAAKNPDILVANPDIRYPNIRIYPLILWQPKSGYLNDRL